MGVTDLHRRRAKFEFGELCGCGPRVLGGDTDRLLRVAYEDATLLGAGLDHEHQNLALTLKRSIAIGVHVVD